MGADVSFLKLTIMLTSVKLCIFTPFDDLDPTSVSARVEKIERDIVAHFDCESFECFSKVFFLLFLKKIIFYFFIISLLFA